MTPQGVQELARHAKSALSNPAIEEAFKRYEAKIIENLRLADPLNVELVLTFKRHLTSLHVVRRNLEIMVDDGKEADQKLAFERQTLAERAKAALRRIA